MGIGLNGAPDVGTIQIHPNGTFDFILSDDEAGDLFGYGDLPQPVGLSTQFEHEITDTNPNPAMDMAPISFVIDTLCGVGGD